MNPALLAQLLRQQQGMKPMGAQAPQPLLPEDANPFRTPTMRSEDPDFLATMLQPVSEEESLFQKQLEQAQALQRGGGRQYTNPLATLISGAGDMLGAWKGGNMASRAEAGLRAANAKRSDIIAQAGKGPSTSAVQQEGARRGRVLEQLMQGRQQDFQRGQQEVQQGFQAGQQQREIAARAAQAGLDRNLTRELEGLKAQRAKEEAEAKGKEAKDKAAGDLRKELQAIPEVKSFFGETEPSYKVFKQAIKGDSGSAGTTAIFTFMKLIDPGVAVMEGDVDRIRKAGGPAAAYADLYQYALTGNPLPAKVRKELEQQADMIYGVKEKAAVERIGQYRGLATEGGADPNRVAPPRVPMPPGLDLNATPPPPKAAGSSNESDALKWARENPNDPRAAEILQLLGGR